MNLLMIFLLVYQGYIRTNKKDFFKQGTNQNSTEFFVQLDWLFILSKENNFLPFTKKALKYESCYETGENWELLENGLQISQTESIEKARFYETSNKNQVLFL